MKLKVFVLLSLFNKSLRYTYTYKRKLGRQKDKELIKTSKKLII